MLVALPLTVLGATWALVFTNTPAKDPMVLVGVVALIGLTVNPAILLVDRMQHRAWYGRMSAGAAALAAVRERARPVLMTATTTIAGLFLLAKPTGRENEIWPPFATIVMGGLVTSTILTLLVIPVGFVFLHRLDRIFGRPVGVGGADLVGHRIAHRRRKCMEPVQVAAPVKVLVSARHPEAALVRAVSLRKSHSGA